MPKLHWDAGFKRSYQKRIKGNLISEAKFQHAIELFAADPFNPKLRAHKLSGELKGLWAFSCAYDCRIVFEFIDKTNVLLIDIGTHDEAY